MKTAYLIITIISLVVVLVALTISFVCVMKAEKKLAAIEKSFSVYFRKPRNKRYF